MKDGGKDEIQPFLPTYSHNINTYIRKETSACHSRKRSALGTLLRKDFGQAGISVLLVGDKVYSSGEIRAYLQKRGIGCTIPHKCNEHQRGLFDKQMYRLRNRIERLVNLYKHFRGSATRYDKRADSYRARWIIVAIFLWLK